MAARRLAKTRLDVLLVERGLAETREKARALVLAGAVMVEGRPARKAAEPVERDVALTVELADQFVSRGGFKLDHALDRFGIVVEGRICLDVGASTGGFTDCLLRRGAGRVYAVDVGHGQLDWGLRNDPRVVVRERTNARYLADLPEPIELAVADVSFISLRLILPPIGRLLRPGASIVVLVKPQFEAGRGQVGRGGVVRDPAIHRRVLLDLWGWSTEHGFAPRGLTPSPIRGPAGNVEFLLHLKNRGSGGRCRIIAGPLDPHAVSGDQETRSSLETDRQDDGLEAVERALAEASRIAPRSGELRDRHPTPDTRHPTPDTR